MKTVGRRYQLPGVDIFPLSGFILLIKLYIVR